MTVEFVWFLGCCVGWAIGLTLFVILFFFVDAVFVSFKRSALKKEKEKSRLE